MNKNPLTLRPYDLKALAPTLSLPDLRAISKRAIYNHTFILNQSQTTTHSRSSAWHFFNLHVIAEEELTRRKESPSGASPQESPS